MVIQDDGHRLTKNDKSKPENKIAELIAISSFLHIVCQEKERNLHMDTSINATAASTSELYRKRLSLTTLLLTLLQKGRDH